MTTQNEVCRIYGTSGNRIKAIADALTAHGFKIDRTETESGLIEKAEKAGVFEVMAEMSLTRRIKRPGVSYTPFVVQVDNKGKLIAGVHEGEKFIDVYGNDPEERRPAKSSRLYDFILDLRAQQFFKFE